LKATACFIICCLTTWITLAVSEPLAASHSVSGSFSTGMLILMQQGPGAPSAERQQADRLLSEARQAMTRGDLPTAQRLIASAEQLNVQYDPLYERFLDTPAKAKRSLNEMLAANAAGDARPSQRFSPTGNQPPGSSGQPASQPAANPVTQQQRLDMLTDDARSKAKSYLDKGRTALQQGDSAGAVAWWRKAAATGAQFAPGEYSPQNLAQQLRQAGVPEQHLIPPTPAVGSFAGTQPPMAARPED
jgi:hypothetical protein